MEELTYSFLLEDKITKERIWDGMAEVYGYSPQIPNIENPAEMIPNPVDKNEFTRRVLASILVNAVRESDLRALRVSLEEQVQPIELK